MSESTIQTAVRLRFSEMRAGILLRYQVGTFWTKDGRVVKIGEPGVSDLIGITPHVVTEADVGRTIGVFTAIEMKDRKGRTSDVQTNFITKVNSLGGLGAVVRSVEDMESLVTEKWNSEIRG